MPAMPRSPRSLEKKLEALGAAGRARLTSAWLDPDVTTRDIESRFGLGPPDIAELQVLLGARARPVAMGTFRKRDVERSRMWNQRRAAR